MKRRMLIGAVAIALLLSGCRGNTPTNPTDSNSTIDTTPTNSTGGTLQYSAGHNAQNKYLLVDGANFLETDDFYIGNGLSGGCLYYYDKASGISGVLCADPACTHDTDDCSAAIGGSASLSYYDGKLWWVDSSGSRDYCLWRSDLSGTSREQIKELSFEDVIMAYQPQRYIIHGGTLYLLGKANTVIGTKTGTRITLLAMSLDSSEEITTLYDQIFDEGVEMTVRFVGENVYLSVVSWPRDGETYDISVTRYGITDGSTETVYEETGMTDYPGKLWVTEQGELYLSSDGDDCGGYLSKLENGTRTEVIAWEGEYSRVYVMDGIVVNWHRDNGVLYTQIHSLTGEPIYEGKLFPEEIPGMDGDLNQYSRGVLGGDTEKLILDLMHPQNPRLHYIIALDINNNMKATVLWSIEE